MRLSIAVLFFLWNVLSYADICPHPLEIYLRNGYIPKPWLKSPVSPSEPNFNRNTVFVGANILTPLMGGGVFCHYKNRQGRFSLWQPANVVIPLGSAWCVLLGGHECVHSVDVCLFKVDEPITPNPM